MKTNFEPKIIDKKLEKVQAWTSKNTKEKLLYFTMEKKSSISRLIAIALEKELLSSRPFDYDLTLPDEEIEEFAYADQAGKILHFLKGQHFGMGLDTLCLCRFDIGVPDKREFLLAFKDILQRDFLESYKPKPTERMYNDYPENYVLYRLKGESTPKKIKERREAGEYERFQKLKKKFKDK